MNAIERLRAIDRERLLLARAAALLQWDEETCMPPAAAEERADQLALLEGLAHEKLAAPETGALLSSITVPASEPGENLDADFVRIFRRDCERAAKLPPGFVREEARAQSLSQNAWIAARKKSDFASFAPHLEKMLDLARRRAGYLRKSGAQGDYDVLLDLYEPGMGEAEIAAVFAPLKNRLQKLLAKIAAAQKPRADFLHQKFEIEKQKTFAADVMKGLGFDLSRGRLDVSAHPFTTTLGFNDVRITTRYCETDPLSGIFSVIHESGHAFYELALDPALAGTCLAEGTSMGIHESQSRLWENVVARSRAFWEGWLPVLASHFPEQLKSIQIDDFVRAANAAGPSLIRTEADEASYSLHIILRFELERRFFAPENSPEHLSVSDAPAAWNKLTLELFGIAPPDDASGILQDVHWPMGAFGYFPSYALGNLYGLQFWQALRADLPDADALLARRDYAPIHRWLAEKIHRWGRRLDPADLLKRVAGGGLSAEPFLEYLEAKYAALYGFGA